MKPNPSSLSTSRQNRRQSSKDQLAALAFKGLLGLGLMLLGAGINDWRKPATKTVVKWERCPCEAWGPDRKCCVVCQCAEPRGER